jgi:hypothetical protein
VIPAGTPKNELITRAAALAQCVDEWQAFWQERRRRQQTHRVKEYMVMRFRRSHGWQLEVFRNRADAAFLVEVLQRLATTNDDNTYEIREETGYVHDMTRQEAVLQGYEVLPVDEKFNNPEEPACPRPV